MSIEGNFSVPPAPIHATRSEGGNGAERNKNAWLRELEKAQSGLARATAVVDRRISGNGVAASAGAKAGPSVQVSEISPSSSTPSVDGQSFFESKSSGAVLRPVLRRAPVTISPVAFAVGAATLGDVEWTPAGSPVPRIPTEWDEALRRQIAPSAAHAEIDGDGRLTLWIRDTSLLERDGLLLARKLVLDLARARFPVNGLVVYLNGRPLLEEPGLTDKEAHHGG